MRGPRRGKRAWIGLVVWLFVQFGPSLAFAQPLRSWVDQDGVLHYSNVKPPKRRSRYRVSEKQEEGFGGEPSILIETVGQPPPSERYDDWFRQAARQYSLPSLYLKAVARVESNFNPDAVSKANAKGLMQLMDATAQEMAVDDPFDPKQSIFGGARYLRLLADRFGGDLVKMTAAYNAGPERVVRAKGVPAIRETKLYVRRVLEVYQSYLQSQ